jgi:hypothetical protein
MGKILILELILSVVLLILTAAFDSSLAIFAFLGIYVISGYRRKYYVDIDIAYAIGIAQNLTAMVAAYFIWFILTFKFSAVEGIFVHYSFFALPLGIIQMLGIRRFLLRFALFLAFISLWMAGLYSVTSLSVVNARLNEFVEFGILFLGVRIFEVIFDSCIEKPKINEILKENDWERYS